ncbi:conserved hypothetical protein [Haloferula helveola]|uniref:Lipoprotein n=1 Tax=Haloferula helveola TaxID=490095 RepID=A0ABN6H172_9BACT|nr:conserved hypothetical protein [Haloferula helveola]
MKRLALPIAALLLSHCSTDLPPSGETQAALNPANDYGGATGEASYGDIARFMAGRPVRAGADLSAFQKNSGDYHTHALELDYIWRKMGSKRSLRQAQYFHDDLRPLLGSPSTVVYPFGGPDILYASSIFPRASTYVLIGLEPVGSVPDVSSSNPLPFLSRISTVMEEPIRHGYYITAEMRNAPSVTPIMMTSIALMGGEVRNVQAISAGGRSGVQIDFSSPYGGNKKVIYVSADLSNSGFGAIRGWLDGYSGATGYFKAASYLPHDGSFSGIRDWMLGNCRAILQDDSGIPYRYYDSNSWDVTLLGNYERPIPLFAKWKQPDLAAAYDAAGPREEIPFGSGYHMKMRDANFQVCKRK